ncbi:hypothetical protein QFZ81_000159 [Paenibacillus sp. V4I9]|uniref:hypothetical protein n=1 Tax=Paenibacillus sp. V4I9 TaxID=3042308 RepID=UPI00277E9649|nr:hypothetical protein [Paenibacillus sp. V4I9]MDQ0885071.1 hypothetical protein [Paenibacillus sp. V4I9]
MKIKLPRHRAVHNDSLKKNLLIINIAFFIMNAFLTFGSSQDASMVPIWLWYSSVTIFVSSLAMFIYGFWLRIRYISKFQLGYFSAVFLLLVSIQLFLTANIQFSADQSTGIIHEQINYFRFSAIEYLSIVILVSLLIYYLSSPKILFKEIKNEKVTFWAVVGGSFLVIITFIFMHIIKKIYFAQPHQMKESYDFLIASVGIGYCSISLFILMYRTKKRGGSN